MNFFIKCFITLVYFAIFITLLILSARQGYLDKPIKTIFEFYLNQKGFHSQINDLHIRNEKLFIGKISLESKDKNLFAKPIAEFTNVNLKFSIDNKVTNDLVIFTAIDVDSFVIKTEDNTEILHTKMIGDYKLNLLQNIISAKINLNSIRNVALSSIYNSHIKDGDAIYNYRNKIIGEGKAIEIEVNFNELNLLFKQATKDGKLKTHCQMTNVPIMVYEALKTIEPKNKIILFLDEYIKDGYINYGEFDLNLDKNFSENDIFTKENLNGKFHIINLQYKYDKDYPPLKDIDIDVTLSGNESKFLINKAYSGKTLVSNGVISLNWVGLENSSIIINGVSKGPVNDLIDFVPNEVYEETKKKGIDLKKFTGIADSIIELIIPINPAIKNTYNISTTISDAGLKLFNNNIIIGSAKLKGVFSGDKLSFIGSGKINQFNSDISYSHNIISNNNDDYKFLLKIKTKIKGENQKIGLVKILSGGSVVNFEYKANNDGQEIMTAGADLKDLEFYLDKISIHKIRHDAANLTVKGTIGQGLQNDIDMKLVGDNNLNITSKIKVSNDKYDIALPKINYADTNISGNITFDKDNFSASIHGSNLDLSNSNMMQFLEKEGEATNTSLKVDIEKIKLKNAVQLDDVKLQILCNKTQCFSGYLDSKIGDRFLRMLLNTSDDQEQWEITSDNAGAVFKGIGLYNKMKDGTMLLIFNSKRHIVHSGQIVPIIDGTFIFRYFLVSDISFLTKIVSFVSLPGFVHFITNNNNVQFSDMNGKFSYIDNVITVSKTSASGAFFDFTMKGTVDNNKRKVELKGLVTPSIYGINRLVRNLPILGSLLSRGHRKGIILAPYSIAQEY